jgi:glycosyltransferase involved in cell wall biosynthesis
MRALILTDADIAAREGQLLSRLEIGLIGHGIRILYAEPADERVHIDAESLIAGLEYNAGGSILTLKARARRLVRDIDEAIGFDDPTTSRLDIVHVIGRGAWRIGLEVAIAADSHLAIEVLSQDELEHVRSFENRAIRAFGVEGRFAWLSPGPGMHAAVQNHAKQSPVFATSWGTHVGEHARRTPAPEVLPSIVIVTSGGSQQRLLSLVDAIKRYKPPTDAEPPIAFLDEHAVSRSHQIARHVREIGIENRLSIVPSLEHSRALAMNCDVLVLPDGDGQHRTITLDAMANGVLVVAAQDPLLSDLLRPDETALIVDQPTPDRWSAALDRALDRGAPQIDAIRENAREAVRQHRLAASHIDAVAAAYDRICGEKAIPFADKSG